jgi:hypothetical protein
MSDASTTMFYSPFSPSQAATLPLFPPSGASSAYGGNGTASDPNPSTAHGICIPKKSLVMFGKWMSGEIHRNPCEKP